MDSLILDATSSAFALSYLALVKSKVAVAAHAEEEKRLSGTLPSPPRLQPCLMLTIETFDGHWDKCQITGVFGPNAQSIVPVKNIVLLLQLGSSGHTLSCFRGLLHVAI